MKLYTERIGSCRACPHRCSMRDWKKSWDEEYEGRFFCTNEEIKEVTEIPPEIGEDGYLEFPDWCKLKDVPI